MIEEEPRGPIPLDRHKAVIENTRKKAAEEALKQYDWVQKYGDAQAAQQRLAVTEWMERDPVGFLRTYAANQGIDPRTLFPQEQAAPAPKAEEPPQPDILLENGQMTYSTERLQQLLAYQERQLSTRFERELAPIKQERAITQLQIQATGKAKQEIAAARNWPGFHDNQADIKAFLEANQSATLRDAYIAVVPAKLAEQAQKAATEAYQKALTDLQTKAGAASGLTPRTTGGSAAPDYGSMSMGDALRAALADG